MEASTLWLCCQHWTAVRTLLQSEYKGVFNYQSINTAIDDILTSLFLIPSSTYRLSFFPCFCLSFLFLSFFSSFLLFFYFFFFFFLIYIFFCSFFLFIILLLFLCFFLPFFFSVFVCFSLCLFFYNSFLPFSCSIPPSLSSYLSSLSWSLLPFNLPHWCILPLF